MKTVVSHLCRFATCITIVSATTGASAQATEEGWLFVAEDEGLSLYLQPNSVIEVGNRVYTGTTVMNYLAEGGHYRSLLSTHTVDCNRLLSRYEISVLYGLYFAKGKALSDAFPADGDWGGSGRDSLINALNKAVCRGR